MLRVVLLLSLLCAMSAAAKEPTELKKDPALEGFVTPTECPEGVSYCFGIQLHVVVADGSALQTPEWFGDQLSQANRLFSPLSIGFYLDGVSALPSDKAEIITRSDRDLLGRSLFSRGVIHVFLVGKLADVDTKDKFLKGVHWRDRADNSRRWIIVASDAWNIVLAHELGHFFGLPHSTHFKSIMNKSIRLINPADLIFVEAEQTIIKSANLSMIKSKMLIAKKP